MNTAAIPRIAAVAALVAAAACAPPPPAAPVSVAMSTTFDTLDIAWAEAPGAGAINGQVRYARDGQTFRCISNVGLTPETPYTRHRFLTLYGSLDRAALPASVVRARTVDQPPEGYSGYVRDTPCDADGRFRFEGLPDGGWFLIAPVRAGDGEPVVLMRRVNTRQGVISVVLD